MSPVLIRSRGLPGPRVWVVGWRIHHGLAGAVVLPLALIAHQPALAFVAALAVVHDRRDWPWPIHERECA